MYSLLYKVASESRDIKVMTERAYFVSLIYKAQQNLFIFTLVYKFRNAQENVMPYFKVKKWQSGTGAWGDGFAWKYEDLILEASSLEELQCELSKINGKEIYANEYLRLRIEGECEESNSAIGVRKYVTSYKFIWE